MLITFIIAFFVISPIIILYTAGYRYDWQNGLLKETGAISIDIQPKNATIYLNGIKLKDKMPVRLNNIAPANYSLKMTAPGYLDWTKNIQVNNKETTYIKEISLLKKTTPQILISGTIDNLALSNDNNFILYSIKKSSGEEIWLWNVQEQKPTFIQNINQQTAPKLEWSQNLYASVSNDSPPYTNLLIVDAQNPMKQTNLAKSTTSTINKYEWDELSGQFYFSTKDDIYSFVPSSQQINSAIKNNYLDWYMVNGQLWSLQFSTSTKKYDLTRDTLGFKSLFNSVESSSGSDNQQEWRLLTVHQNTALLKNTSQPEMILLTADKKFNISGDNFHISKYNDWWLIWTQWELWTYSQDQEPYLLNRSGEHLNDVFPLDSYNTLGLVWENNATALYPYYLVTHDLVNEKIDKAVSDTDDKILYFTAKINNNYGIWKLNY